MDGYAWSPGDIDVMAREERATAWTVEFDGQVRAFFAAGLDDLAIAAEMGRTPEAIRARRRVLGLTRPANGAKWTAERVAMLETLWGTMSTAHIATAINTAVPGPKLTKHAVIGKAFRLGLRRLVSGSGAVGRKRKEDARKQAPAPKPAGLALMQLTNTTCRWPHGDGPYTYCGARCLPTEPYCTHHMGVAYVGVKRKEPSNFIPRVGQITGHSRVMPAGW